jgi:metallophosphoesterase superfamily enzyme
MKLIILGDTHFGMRGDSLEFHNYYKRFYQEVFFPYIVENNITTIFQMGDLFDRRKFINFNTLYLSRQYFFNKVKERGLEFHTILGNHDIYYKNVLEVNSSQMLLNDYENITVYDEPNKITFDGVEVDVIPWICSDNEEQIKKFIETSTFSFVFVVIYTCF